MHESMKGGGGKTGGGEGGGGEREKERKKRVGQNVWFAMFSILCLVKMLQLLFDPKKFKIRDRIFLKSFTFLHKFTAVAASC